MIPNHPVIQILIILGTITILQSFGSNPVRRYSSLLVCTCNILSVILRCTTEMAGVSHQASAYKKIPETFVKILNFWGLTFTILSFSSGCHWQSTSSRTFIYSNVSFIIHYVLNQIEGMQRSVEDNCGKVEKHNIYMPLFSTFNICENRQKDPILKETFVSSSPSTYDSFSCQHSSAAIHALTMHLP